MEEKSKSGWSEWSWKSRVRSVEWYWAIIGILFASLLLAGSYYLTDWIDTIQYDHSNSGAKLAHDIIVFVLASYGVGGPFVIIGFMYLIIKDIRFLLFSKTDADK